MNEWTGFRNEPPTGKAHVINFSQFISVTFMKEYCKNFLKAEGLGDKVTMQFICTPCRTGEHDECLGGPNADSTWCDCHHKDSIGSTQNGD